MNFTEQPNYNIREYAVGSTSNRNNFQAHTYSETLKGQSECYHSLYLHSSDIKKFVEANFQLKQKLSIQGFKGNVYTTDLTIDIDLKENLERAQDVARLLVQRLLVDFSFPPHWLRIRFSGNKGFHLIMPAIAFGGFNPSSDLPALQATIVHRLTDGFEDCVDWGIYYHVSLIRIENTLNAKSGRFCIPLLHEELTSLKIEEIKDLATKPRDLAFADISSMTSLTKLVELKQECQLSLRCAPTQESFSTSSANEGNNYPTLNPVKISTVFKRCAKMAEILSKSEKKEPMGHQERLNLGCVLCAFGKDGKSKVHELLKNQDVYDEEKTSYYLETMAASAYKPSLCDRICGPENRCEAMKTIRRKSPIAFAYTYDQEIDGKQRKFIESYAVDTVVSHITNVIYAISDRSFYRYIKGVYSLLQDEDLKSEIEPMLHYYVSKDLITNAALNNVVERFKIRNEIRFDGEFDSDPFILNLRNGLLDIRTGDILPHTPEFKSRIQLPVTYDAKATCPMFLRFLDEVFRSDKEVIDYVLKMLAYFLIPSYAYHKVFVWHGIGRNGKGRLARVVENLLGKENVAHEDIHDLATEPFAKINLLGKLVNFSSEPKSDDLDMSAIKRLSGEDMISTNKKHKDYVTFLNKARLVLLANDLPRFSEVGQAVMQRFEFISFSRSFLGADADTTLDAKLQKEIPGIFNYVLAKIPDIMDAAGGIYFQAPPAIDKMKEILIADTSTIAEFVKEACKTNPQGEIKFSTFNNRYNYWVKDSGYRALGKKNVAKALRETLGLRVENSTKNNQVTIYGLEPINPVSFGS